MILYTKYSNDRRPELAIRTIILKDENGQRKVRKTADNMEAHAHIKAMAENGNSLEKICAGSAFCVNRHKLISSDTIEFEYLSGWTLEEEMNENLKDPKALKDKLSEYLKAIEALSDVEFKTTEAFENVFGKNLSFKNKAAISVANIDMVLSNIIINNGWQMIDYEWTFKFPVPVSFIIWRVLHYYFSFKGEDIQFVRNELAEEFDLKDEDALFDGMERSFQRYVDGSHKALRHLYQEITPGVLKIGANLNATVGGDKTFDMVVSEVKDGILSDDRRSYVSNQDGCLEADIPVAGMQELNVKFAEQPMIIHILSALADGKELTRDAFYGGPLNIHNKDLVMVSGERNMRIRLQGQVSSLHLSFKADLVDPRMIGTLADLGATIYGEQIEWNEKERQYRQEIEQLKERVRRDEDLLEMRSNATIELGQTKVVKAYRKLRLKMGKGDPMEYLRPHLDHEKSEIIYNVDSVTYHQQYLTVHGWVYDPVYKRETLRFCDGDGTPLKVGIQRKLRPDVTQLFGIESWRMVGFDASFTYEEIKNTPLILEIEDPRGYFAHRIDLDNKMLEKGRNGNIKPEIENEGTYDDFFHLTRPGKDELSRQRVEKFLYEPLISIVIPLYKTPEIYLKALLDSLLAQTYSHFEICLADGSPDEDCHHVIRENYGSEKRIVYKHLEQNKGIAYNTNEAIALATGEFILLADHDDELAENALYEIVKSLNEFSDVDIVYTDEDKISSDGKVHFDPNFKPDFDLDYLRSTNYICHIFCVRKTLVDEVGGEREGFEGAQDYDFILRCTEKARKIVHVPKVLYYWRSYAESTAFDPTAKGYARESGRRALQEHYERLGVKAGVYFIEGGDGYFKSRFLVEEAPLVSVIIVENEKENDLQKTKSFVETKSHYKNKEVLSSGRDAISLNQSVRKAKGKYVVFLEAGSEIKSPEWIEELLSTFKREKVGAVGSKVLYEDGTIAQAGLALSKDGSIHYTYKNAKDDIRFHYGRGNVVHGVKAVSLGGMMTEKETFEKYGGFTEAFTEDYLAADYCLKLSQKDCKIVENPFSVLIKGTTEKVLSDNERAVFMSRWKKELEKGDPFQNPNLDAENEKYIKMTE